MRLAMSLLIVGAVAWLFSTAISQLLRQERISTDPTADHQTLDPQT